MITMDRPVTVGGERDGAEAGEWDVWDAWDADRDWSVERTTAIATAAGLCTTCRRMIRAGEEHHRDRWCAPVLGRRVASAICAHCAAAGL